ncbi:hypothetical protein [Endozoicomonas sp. SCSIO W0465]|uniref:hypothetical protein n=1 Tax=Endozoicomonas sp. SCSIO W0465 TaxID=2918516 RepID=UPI002075EDDD|nr:hypothetical protein [Endozoicomonas sp. SCSIO W0465]USE34996.1 hypothetical protein MJO57_23175 [Endozoicomonas sp. SCSIO W0465]
MPMPGVPRWRMICDYVHDEPSIFTREGRSSLYKEETRKSRNNNSYRHVFVETKDNTEKFSAKFFLKILKIYWKRGKSEFSLYPDYSNCGTTPIPKDKPGKKRGRKYKENPNKGIALTEKDKDIFKKFIVHEKLNNKKSLQKSYDALIASNYYKYEFDSNGNIAIETFINDITKAKETRKKELRDDYKPSYAQFKNFYYKNYTREERERNRIGEQQTTLSRTPKTGSQVALYPGHAFEIDATILDFYIKSHREPFNLIGQPTFYVVIDVYSRFIIGWHMALGKPSGTTALAALVNMATDKKTLLKKLNYIEPEYTKGKLSFNIGGIPKKLIIDQGELRGYIPEHIQKTFNIHIETTASKRPDWKGTVERRFNTLQSWEKIYDPSYGNMPKKRYGDPDIRKNAIKTFKELYHDFLDLILLHNHSTIRNPRIHTNLSLEENIATRPYDLFQHGIEQVGGSIFACSEGHIRRHFLKPGTATITEEGIKYKGLLYQPLTEHADELLSSSIKTQYQKTVQNNRITILEHESIIDAIYLPLDSSNTPIECALLPKSKLAVQADLSEGIDTFSRISLEGLSWIEYDDYKDEYHKKSEELKKESAELQQEIDKRMSERKKEAAKKTNNETGDMSQNQFLKGANERKKQIHEEHLQEEANDIKSAYASQLDEITPNNTPVEPNSYEEHSYVNLIKQSANLEDDEDDYHE